MRCFVAVTGLSYKMAGRIAVAGEHMAVDAVVAGRDLAAWEPFPVVCSVPLFSVFFVRPRTADGFLCQCNASAW